MDERAFDVFTRAAAAMPRRRSLLMLGGAGLAALTRPSTATAAKKAKKKCKKEKKQCRMIIQEECGSDQGCLDALLPCCESCKVGQGVICVLELL